jgi:hypothetical protein
MIKHLKLHLAAYLTLLLVAIASGAYASYAHAGNDEAAEATNPAVAPTRPDDPPEPAPAALASCPTGSVRGYARVRGHSGMGKDWTSAITAIDRVYNCAGGKVEVRRESQGHFYVRFLGNPSRMALGISNTDGLPTNSTGDDNVISINRVTSGPDTEAFRVEVEDINGSGTAAQDGWFNLVVF